MANENTLGTTRPGCNCCKQAMLLKPPAGRSMSAMEMLQHVRPRISVVRMLPSALLTASASQLAGFSELNLHGLLPCCVRFAHTSHPVNGNTRFRSVCSTVTERDFHPLDSIKKFHRFISVPPLPDFSQRDDNVGGVIAATNGHYHSPPVQILKSPVSFGQSHF